MFIKGKLYKDDHASFLVFSSKKKLNLIGIPAGTAGAQAPKTAESWSKILGCQVRYSEPGEIFMFLEQDGDLLYVLFGDKQGWIINKNWMKIEEAQSGI